MPSHKSDEEIKTRVYGIRQKDIHTALRVLGEMSDDANNGAEVQRRVLNKLRARVKSGAVERVLIAPKHVEYRIVVKEQIK
jgi:hypothetical protein